VLSRPHRNSERTAHRAALETRAVAGQLTELAPGIYAVRVFGVAEAAELVRTIGACAWEGATINAERAVDRAVRDADILDEVRERALIRRCRDRLFAATRGLAAQLVPFATLAEVQIVRYLPGGHFVEHRDSPARGASPRVLSIVCYLNADFSGGATAFFEPDAVVQPQAGMAIAFAPERSHRAEPVSAGTKYAVTGWYLTPQSVP
jgi:Rps23 Pro-64 3,4-dihydroxylase Tpa1-like proline 4-hydroxylase